MKNVKLLGALTLAGTMILSAAVFTAPALGQASTAAKAAAKNKDDKKKDEKKAEGAVKIGEPAPAFTLTDTDGKTVNLADYAGKMVVLEWYNPECPFIVKHHSESKGNMTFNKLHAEYASKGVTFLAINSGAKGKQGNGKELNIQKKAEYKLPYAVLLDEDGKVGNLYGAKTTPHVFIIGKDGKLAYKGAIDNNDDPEKGGDKNYAKLALDEMIAGKAVSTSETKPYGCSVKYGK